MLDLRVQQGQAKRSYRLVDHPAVGLLRGGTIVGDFTNRLGDLTLGDAGRGGRRVVLLGGVHGTLLC